MAAIGITEESVFEAARALKAKGTEPTIKLIRDELGSGSFATISKHLKTWKEQTDKKPTPAFPENLAKAAQGFWNFAFREAESILATDKAAVLMEREKWQKEREQLLTEIEKLEVSHHTKDNRMKEVLSELERERKVQSQKDESIMKMSQLNTKLQTKLEAAEERLTEEKARSARLEKDLADIAKKK